MAMHLDQLAEPAARLPNYVIGGSVFTVLGDWIGMYSLESWALLVTIICALLGLMAKLWHDWALRRQDKAHKRKMLALREQEVRNQARLLEEHLTRGGS